MAKRTWYGRRIPEQGQEQAHRFAYVGAPLDVEDVYRALQGGAGNSSVSREQANSVPALVRARNMLLAAVSIMELYESNRTTHAKVDNAWLAQLNNKRPNVNELSDTINDLFYDNVAYWRVLSRSEGRGGIAGTGFPTETERLDPARVTPQPGKAKPWRYQHPNGIEVELSASEIIQFEGIAGGVLHEGANQAIRDALRLGRAAGMFSASPLPLGWFQSEDIDPEPEDVQEFLQKFSRARQTGAYGFIPAGYTFNVPEWNPKVLQLDEAKRETTVDIGRGTGAQLEALGVSTTSRTYFNATQVRQDFLDFTVRLYMTPILQRLSMPDVTTRPNAVLAGFEEFLRTDDLTRGRVQQIGLETGRYADEDEVRLAEKLPPLTKEQRARRAERTAQATSKPTPGKGTDDEEDSSAK